MSVCPISGMNRKGVSMYVENSVYAVSMKVDGVVYRYILDSGLSVAQLIQGTTGSIEDLTITARG